MKNTKKILVQGFAFLVVFMLLLTPALSFAAYKIGDPIVPDCPAQGCGWNELLALINNSISFILYGMAVPIAAIMFAYAGFLMVTAGGEAAHARTKAKTIFTNALIGLALAATCWIIVRTLLSIAGYEGDWIGF